jgi:hypothetical protein
LANPTTTLLPCAFSPWAPCQKEHLPDPSFLGLVGVRQLVKFGPGRSEESKTFQVHWTAWYQCSRTSLNPFVRVLGADPSLRVYLSRPRSIFAKATRHSIAAQTSADTLVHCQSIPKASACTSSPRGVELIRTQFLLPSVHEGRLTLPAPSRRAALPLYLCFSVPIRQYRELMSPPHPAIPPKFANWTQVTRIVLDSMAC